MKIAVRVLIYVVLLGLVIWTGRGFIDSFRSGTGARDLTQDERTSTEAKRPTPSETGPADESSNTNSTSTEAGSSNLVAGATNEVDRTAVATGISNGVPSGVVAEAGSTNEPAMTPAPASETQSSTGGKKAKKSSNHMVAFLGGFVLSAAALGLLGARDFSTFFANKSLEFLFNDDGKGVKNPELEAAEAIWAAGDKLEAIRQMRDYYERNPREVFVALRIAEIYEQDLGNYLAAALELEEVLVKKLPPDRWGWSALRLCNLYSKLDKADKAIELLRRVAVEHSQTPAAEKARKRLAQVDPEFLATMAVTQAATKEPADPGPKAPDDDKGRGNLPPGFRPKK